MYYALFSDEWARVWCENINANASYREAARDWTTSLVLKAESGSGENRRTDAVYLELRDGGCTACRAAANEDVHAAAYVISAGGDAWKKVLQGDLEILSGIMWGRIKLDRGDLSALAQHLSAAKQLLLSATDIQTSFQDE